MIKKCGIVMEVKNGTACLLTSVGEFVQVKIDGNPPTIGSSYAGEEVSKFPLNKFIAAVACLILSFSICGGAYAYYTPVASVLVKITPAVELKINRWDKIIAATPLNTEGKHILESIQVKNKSINIGLNIILNQAEKQNLINKKQNNTISLCINSNKDLDLKIAELKSKIKNKDFNLEITPYTNSTNEAYNKDKEKTNKSNIIHSNNQEKNFKKDKVNNKDVNTKKSDSLKNNKTNIINSKNNSVNSTLKLNNKKNNNSSNINTTNKPSNKKTYQDANKKNINNNFGNKNKKYNSQKQKINEKEGNNKKSSN